MSASASRPSPGTRTRSLAMAAPTTTGVRGSSGIARACHGPAPKTTHRGSCYSRRMTAPARTQILYPLFAMVLLVAVVFLRMGRARFGAVRRGEMNPRFYRTYDEGQEPEHLRVITRHFINLFEMPVLFYVAVLTTYVTDEVSWWTVACAWA